MKAIIETIRLPFTLYRFRVIASYLSKVGDFNLPYTVSPAFVAPVGVTPFEFRRDLWRQKTRVPVAIT